MPYPNSQLRVAASGVGVCVHLEQDGVDLHQQRVRLHVREDALQIPPQELQPLRQLRALRQPPRPATPLAFHVGDDRLLTQPDVVLAQVVLHIAELRVDARHLLELPKRCARERRNLLGRAVRGFEVAGLVSVDHAELVAVLRRLRADLHRRCVQPLVVGPVRGALQRSPRANGERCRADAVHQQRGITA